MTYDNPGAPYGGPFTDDPTQPPSARHSLVQSIRRAVDAARQIDDPFSPGYQLPGQNAAADIRAMSSLILQATRRVRELLLDPDAGPPRFGTVGLMIKESGGTKEEELALLALLRDALEIPDFEERCAAAMQQILEGALPRIAGLTRDDDEDDDELTPEEAAEQLTVTAMNAREALARISVEITEPQSFDFVRHFWDLIDEYNAKVAADEGAAHIAAVEAMKEELGASGAEVLEWRRGDAVPGFTDQIAAKYSAALQIALAEKGVSLDGEACRTVIVRTAEIQARVTRGAASEDGADAEG